jgi:hypothetical protein
MGFMHSITNFSSHINLSVELYKEDNHYRLSQVNLDTSNS